MVLGAITCSSARSAAIPAQAPDPRQPPGVKGGRKPSRATRSALDAGRVAWRLRGARMAHLRGGGLIGVAHPAPRHNDLVFDFGIEGYQPLWLHGRDAIAAAHGRRLAALTGHLLRHVWLVWDLDADEWFADGPVLLDFGADQVEVNHQKFDDLSITWNSADPSRPVIWPTSDSFHLAWRPEPLPLLAPLSGQKLHRVELLEWLGNDMANGSIALGYTFQDGQLTIFNALDENGIEDTPPEPNYRRHPLTP